MKRVVIMVAVGLAACGGRLEAESSAVMGAAPNPCGAPTFGPGECVDEVLNDGGSPDDHRRVGRRRYMGPLPERGAVVVARAGQRIARGAVSCRVGRWDPVADRWQRMTMLINRPNELLGQRIDDPTGIDCCDTDTEMWCTGLSRRGDDIEPFGPNGATQPSLGFPRLCLMNAPSR